MSIPFSKPVKPLGYKAYGSIPHLPGSRLGPGDHHCEEGQARIATVKKRDKHDFIIVQEKLDGSNVAVAKVNGAICPLTRAGYSALASPYEQHQMFHHWVFNNYYRFEEMLQDGERLCGEWLLQAHGTRYNLPHEPFVAFDIIVGKERLIYEDFSRRARKFDFTLPQLLHWGDAFSIEQALEAIKVSGHGAIDPVEGAVWRVERNNRVDFLCKYVRHDKEDGKYLPERNGTGAPIYNQYPNQ